LRHSRRLHRRRDRARHDPGPRGTEVVVDKDEGRAPDSRSRSSRSSPPGSPKTAWSRPVTAANHRRPAAVVLTTSSKPGRRPARGWTLGHRQRRRVEPSIMGIGPAFAIPKALAPPASPRAISRRSRSTKLCRRKARVPEKLGLNGSFARAPQSARRASRSGHPLGASEERAARRHGAGTICAHRRRVRRRVACIGGGQGILQQSSPSIDSPDETQPPRSPFDRIWDVLAVVTHRVSFAWRLIVSPRSLETAPRSSAPHVGVRTLDGERSVWRISAGGSCFSTFGRRGARRAKRSCRWSKRLRAAILRRRSSR